MYLLIHTFWNGAIPIKSCYSAYKTKEVAGWEFGAFIFFEYLCPFS